MHLILILILTLNFSCAEKKSSENDTGTSESARPSKSDTLKFVSGIRAILQDSKGNYWFGSHQEGVGFYDGKSFEYFTTNEGLWDNQIRSILEDASGTIWFGTANGVSSYDGENLTKHTPIENGEWQSEWIKTENDLWFNAGTNPGVYRYDGQNLHYLAFPELQVVNPDNRYLVTGLAEGEDDMLWIGTYAGVIGYNGDQFTILNDATLKLKEEADLLHVRSIFEDSKGRLWIGNNGIGVLLRDRGATTNFSEKNNLIHPTSSRRGDKSPAGTLEHVFAIGEDGEGNIWFGDRDAGVWKYDGESMTNYIVDSTLSTQMVWSISRNKVGDLLFGMAAGGVYTFNGESFERMF